MSATLGCKNIGIRKLEFLAKAHFLSNFFSHRNLFAKELSLCHKLRFCNPYIFATQCRRPLIFQTMHSVRSNSLSLKYQGFSPSGCQYIGIRKYEFVTKTQFL